MCVRPLSGLLFAVFSLGCWPSLVFGSNGYEVEEIAASEVVPASSNRAYRLLIPEGIAVGEKLPLVIYLHGAGSKGSDNLKQTSEPLPSLLVEPAMRERYRAFVLVPQCRDGVDGDGRPNNWVKWVGQKENPPAEWKQSDEEPSDQLQAAMAAFATVCARHPIDPSRVYLSGVSMGGSGSWWWATRQPKAFAAVITACGLSEVSKASTLGSLPIWAFHGSADEIAPIGRSRQMVAAIRAIGGPIQFTEYPGVGHGIAGRVFIEKDHAVLTWLFSQRLLIAR